MKKVAVGVIVCLLFLGIVSTASANLAQFAGKWKNTNPNTRGVTTIEITISGTNVMVHAWGQCQPTDCDWGNVQGFAYGPNVSSDLQAAAQAITAIYRENFKESLMIIRFASRSQLRVETYTRFTDKSNRTNYVDVEMFAPAITAGPLKQLSPQTGSTFTTTLIAPKQLSPQTGSTFNYFPRKTTLRWSAVPGATAYGVEIDCFSCCENNRWCTDVGKEWKVVPNLSATEYTFDFVGAQPGRWRVWAVGHGGETSPKTGWWEFKYTK